MSSSSTEAAFAAAKDVARLLQTGSASVSSRDVARIMTMAFGGTDAAGAWDWKQASDCLEAAQMLALQNLHAEGRTIDVAVVSAFAGRLPTQTKRSEEMQALQQFSTPLPIAFAMAQAAVLRAGDVLLEPSAGTGCLAVFGIVAGATLHLNEWGHQRANLLRRLFPSASVTGMMARACMIA